MMRSSILALLGLVAVTFAVPTSLSPQRISFEDYVVQFNKQYDTREFQVRKSIFEANLEKIEAHNAKGTSSHTKGVNKFTDWTEQEMKRMFGFDKNLNVHRRIQRFGQNFFRSSVTPRLTNTSNLPTSVDWTTKGVLTHVKNQGGCGSCWAFAGTEAIEANIAIETGHLLTLAPQQFVDCVVNTDQCGGSGGCEGATPDLLFAYAQSHGVFNETQYPYKAEDMTCKNLTNPVATITGWSDVLSNDYDGLMEAVVKQPVTVGVAASSWGYYSGGVLGFSECDADIDHAVLLVGYGTDPQLGDYWKIQNSWGSGWGEKGFIRLARSASDNKNCKQDKNPADGFACNGGPKEVTVCGTCGILYLPSYPTGGHVIN